MPILKPTPPDLSTRLVRTYLNNRTLGLKVYVFGLQQIVADAKPEEQDLAGWRYLTDIAPDFALAGHVKQRMEDQTPSFVGLSYGRQAAKAVRAIKKIETLDDPLDYTLSLLSIPGLLTESLWLRSPNAVSDLVVPYDTLAEGLTEDGVYKLDEFLDIIRPLAQKRLSDLEPLDNRLEMLDKSRRLYDDEGE